MVKCHDGLTLESVIQVGARPAGQPKMTQFAFSSRRWGLSISVMMLCFQVAMAVQCDDCKCSTDVSDVFGPSLLLSSKRDYTFLRNYSYSLLLLPCHLSPFTVSPVSCDHAT